MTFRLLTTCAACLLVAANAFAQDAAPAPATPASPAPAEAPSDAAAPAMILATTARSTYGGKTADEDCDRYYDQRLDEGTVVIIIGVKDCAPRYGTPKRLFEIAYRNDTYFVPREDLTLNAEYQTKLDAVAPADWEAVRSFGHGLELSRWGDVLGKALKDFQSKAALGLAVGEWSVVDESEYTSGTGLRIEVHNPTKKTIKYIWFTFVGVNAVDDVVGGVHTVRAIGPIKPDEGGSYRFEYVWMTDIIESARMRQIKVQYMDGSVKVIAQPTKAFLGDESIETLKSE